MARIQHVDYLAIPGQANEMESCGTQLNKELTTAYESVNAMHAEWFGIRYNSLVEVFNKMIPSLNEMLTLVITNIPETLRTVANNYSRVDRGSNATSEGAKNPNLIVNIPVSNDVGMKFITSSVQARQEAISTNFRNAVAQMNQIEAIYQKIDWESEAAEAFRKKFTTLKTQIVENFEETNTQFKTLMEQTIQDNQKAENANTVN